MPFDALRKNTKIAGRIAWRKPCDLARIGADAASKAGYALVAAMVTHKIKIMLLRFKQKRAIIVATLEGGEAKPDRIKAVIDNKVGKITKKEIMELCPDISKVTVERTLTDLVKSGYIAKVGAGPSTGYVRI